MQFVAHLFSTPQKYVFFHTVGHHHYLQMLCSRNPVSKGFFFTVKGENFRNPGIREVKRRKWSRALTKMHCHLDSLDHYNYTDLNQIGIIGKNM